MAKKPKAVSVNVAVLTAIANAGDNGRVSKADGEPLVAAGLIQVDTTNLDAQGNALARATDAGNQYLNNLNSGEEKGKPMFGIMKGIPIPESQRGNKKGAGAPAKYPFETMEVGDTFFVGNSQVKNGDASKSLASTVSQQNMQYRTETGETETKERTKRGEKNKAVLDAEGNKVKETVTVPVYKQTRKYVSRAVKASAKYGDWTPPEDGVLVAREA